MAKSNHATGTSPVEISRSLLRAGIIAQCDGGFPSAEFLEIVDAFLAAPVLAVCVSLSSPRALEAISQIRTRGGKHVVVGADNVCTARDVGLAVDAGAQFLVSPFFDRASSNLAHALKVLYIPGIFVHAEAAEALDAGHVLLHLFPSDILGPSHLLDLRTSLPVCAFIPSSGIHLHNISAHAKAGAAAIMVECGPRPGEAWTQAQIITQVRSLRRIWEGTRLEMGSLEGDITDLSHPPPGPVD